MDKILFKLIGQAWGRNIIYSVFGLMSGAISWQAWEGRRIGEAMEKEREAAKVEIRECYRQCSIEKDLIRKEHLASLSAALERQQRIEDELRKIKTKKR